MVDLQWDREAALVRAADDEELLKELMEMMCQALRDSLARTSSALEAGDLAEAAMAAHSLKGAAGNLSIEGLRRAAETAEMAAREGDEPGLRQSLPLLEAMAREWKKLCSP